MILWYAMTQPIPHEWDANGKCLDSCWCKVD